MKWLLILVLGVGSSDVEERILERSLERAACLQAAAERLARIRRPDVALMCVPEKSYVEK